MCNHQATISWRRSGPDFLAGRYSSEHMWTFDGVVTVPASPSPSVVPAPWSNAAHVDPEEACVAAIASCHMLTYLYIASQSDFQVDSCQDRAAGVMTKDEQGAPRVSRVTLHPQIVYSGNRLPTRGVEARLHHQAHEQCFIANSVKTEVVVNGS